MAEATPDVACLQEIKTGNATVPARAISDAGYSALWHGQRAHHGVAILVRGRTPREIRRTLPGDDDDAQSRYLEAEVDGIVVASVYLPNGNPPGSSNFAYKLAWFERLIAHAGGLCASPVPALLAGDFNVVPTNADIYNAWAWRSDAVMQPQARDAYRRLIAQGWVDATRALHPHERVYTFWVHDEAFRRNHGFRMDFLLLNPALAPRLSRTGVDREQRGRTKPSDHAPVWVEID